MRDLFLVTPLLLAAMPASAVTIDASQILSGQTQQVIGDATLVAVGGTLNVTHGSGLDSLGVAGGYQNDEIDSIGEHLIIQFTDAVVITEIVIGRLFARGVLNDIVDEGAVFTTDDDLGHCTGGCTLRALSGGPSWDGQGAASAIPGHGTFSLTDPFGEAALTSLDLYALLVQGFATGAVNSDFALVSLSYESAGSLPNVPEPGTFALLACGLLGLALKRR